MRSKLKKISQKKLDILQETKEIGNEFSKNYLTKKSWMHFLFFIKNYF